MSSGDDRESQADAFLELEQELTAGRRSAKTYEEGNVAEATTIPADDVPDDYPVPIGTSQALQLNVEAPDGETVVTYLEWPGEDEESDHLTELLDALGRSRDEFADVYGDRVALDTADGWHGIDPERTVALHDAKRASADDSLDATRTLLAAAVGIGTLTVPVAAVDLFVGRSLLFLSWVGIPAAIYLDGKRLERTTEWTPKTGRWLLGGFVPFFNVPVGVVYLLDRRARLSGPTSERGSKQWQRSIYAALATLPLSVAVQSVSMATAGQILVYGWVLVTCSVYFDAGYVEGATDWNPNRKRWTIVTALFGMVGATAYLLKRRRELG